MFLLVVRGKQMLEPPKKTRLYENIIDQLLSLIKDGTLKPGDKLPTERKLAEDLGVSRTAIREALRSLEVIGYIHSKVGGGTYIDEITLENVMSPFSVVLSQNKKLIIELIDVRMLLETEITRLATKRITLSKLKKIQKALDDMCEEINNGTNGLTADNSFHNALSAASENEALKLILDMCGNLLSQTREATLNIPGQPERTLEEHKAIFEAIRKGDSDLAAFRMQQHLNNAKNNLEKYQNK